MKCPRCGSGQTKISNTRRLADDTVVRRQRTCLACRYIWYTREQGEKPKGGIEIR